MPLDLFYYLKSSFRGSTNLFFQCHCIVQVCCVNCHCIYYRLTVEPPLHSCERWRVYFTLLTANFTAVMEGSTTSTLNKDPKDQKSQESLIGANWPSLPVPANSQNSQEKTGRPGKPNPARAKKPQRLSHGIASREDLRITRETGWANMPNISKGMKYCPSLKS